MLDERKAYRQAAVKPEHRKFSVICLKNPHMHWCSQLFRHDGSLVWFGLCCVYSYHRRSAAINEFLVSIFGLGAFSFYDDKYVFEPRSSVESVRFIAECVHTWLGAKFDQKKLQLSSAPTIL